MAETLRYWLDIFHCMFWARMHFAHAYLAYYRDERVICAQHEQAMRDYEHQLKLVKFHREQGEHHDRSCRY